MAVLEPAPTHELTGGWEEDGMVFRASALPAARYVPCDLATMCVYDLAPLRPAEPAD